MTQEEKQVLIAGIEEALDEIRPHLNSDGGDIAVVDVTDENIVQISWKGNCQICRFSDMTMKNGVEEVIRKKFHHIEGVVAVDEISST